MKIRVSDLKANFIMYFTLVMFVIITLVSSFGTLGTLMGLVLFAGVCFSVLYKMNKRSELSTVLAIPVLLSVFQNVYLGMFSPRLSSTSVQILTVFNFLLACLIFAYLSLSYRRSYQGIGKFVNLFWGIVLYSLLSVVFLNSINVISIISSLRNIISIFLFFLIGCYASKRVEIRKFENIILLFGIIVMLVGIYDVLSGGTMWRSLNITDLWTKKGIRVQASGLPTNFYSSETINGARIRRMASTFADPVNLGAFLFAVFCVAWHRKKPLLQILMIIGMVLTVSKGAWMGLLVFVCVYAYFYLPRPIFLFAMVFAGLMGMAFLLYAFKTSANSVFLHISGLTAAFKGLIYKPLGAGIGSNGVLARQFSGVSTNTEVTETGLGMIISQLGIIGFAIYACFFYYLIKNCMKIKDLPGKTLSLALLLSIVLNIFFNEVALSPNSCAIYLMIIGYFIAMNQNKEKESLCRKVEGE